MQHYKTFHLGCTKSDEVASTENNFDRINCRFNAAHRPIMGVLCRHFFYAQLLQQEGLLNKPYKLALIFFKGILENINEDVLEKKINKHNVFKIKDTIYFFFHVLRLFFAKPHASQMNSCERNILRMCLKLATASFFFFIKSTV